MGALLPLNGSFPKSSQKKKRKKKCFECERTPLLINEEKEPLQQ